MTPTYAIPARAWVKLAACRGHRMFLENPTTTGVVRELIAATVAETCDVCPVLDPCREWAMTTPDPAKDGIAGGLAYYERQAVRKREWWAS